MHLCGPNQRRQRGPPDQLHFESLDLDEERRSHRGRRDGDGESPPTAGDGRASGPGACASRDWSTPTAVKPLARLFPWPLSLPLAFPFPLPLPFVLGLAVVPALVLALVLALAVVPALVCAHCTSSRFFRDDRFHVHSISRAVIVWRKVRQSSVKHAT